MLKMHKKYNDYFLLVRALRQKLLPTGQVYLLNNYLNHLYSYRETDQYMGFEDQIEGPLVYLHQKCMSILTNKKLGNDTWFSKLMRDYIQAHPLDEFSNVTRCQIYCWVLFPAYYQYSLETMEENSEYQYVYGQHYQQLCRLLGKRAMNQLIDRFEACFGGVSGSALLLRACRDRLLNSLMEKMPETNQRLHELLLARPELLDYQWIDAYMGSNH